MQKHTTTHLENKNKNSFYWGSDGWVAQIYVGVVFNVSSILMILIADLIACRLNFFHECCGI